MFELFLVVGVLLGVSLLGVLTVALTPRIMVELGIWVLAGGCSSESRQDCGTTSHSTERWLDA